MVLITNVIKDMSYSLTALRMVLVMAKVLIVPEQVKAYP
jgi:hypothetical protein